MFRPLGGYKQIAIKKKKKKYIYIYIYIYTVLPHNIRLAVIAEA